jgi:Histone methylation protein DOT1
VRGGQHELRSASSALRYHRDMSVQRGTPSLRQALRSWWEPRSKRNGTWQTAREFFSEMRGFALDSMPERRRQRYGDMEYDWEHRVDTTSATVNWRNRLLGVLHSPYQPTEPDLFREMIETLAIDYRQYTFVDIGSGKGRTLLMASEYPFKRVIGVELLPELHRVATENIMKLLCERSTGVPLESICGDAVEFVLPEDPLVLYLFNPLPETGLEQLMANVESSIRRSPRPFWVVYHNPIFEEVVARRGTLRRVGGTSQYAVYASEA